MTLLRCGTGLLLLGAVAVAGCGADDASSESEVNAKKFTTPAPKYDKHVADRKACTFGPGAKTTDTVGPEVPHGDALPFNHVVVLMLENRSFDHYFSELNAVYGSQIDVASENQSNPDPSAAGFPSGSQSVVHRFHETRYCMADTTHEWPAVHLQYDDGKMDGFVATNNPGGGRAMGYYTKDDLPYDYWLADTFSISDRHFSSLLGPTWPNRYFFYGATSWGRTLTPDVPVVGKPEIIELMKNANRSWRIYREGAISFSAAAFANLDYFGADMWDSSNHVGTTFEKDVKGDHLPDLSILDPNFFGSGQDDEHPPSDIQLGQKLVARVIATLMSNKSVWEKTVLIITYDEHGGYYDHVAPPEACEPDDNVPPDYRFDRLGVRIPLMVVSPFAKKHYLTHIVTDQTSITRFIENRFDLPAMTRRDANAWPMLDMFDFETEPFRDAPAPPPGIAEPDPDGLAWCKNNPPGTGNPESAGGAEPTEPPAGCESIEPEPNDAQVLSRPLPSITDCNRFKSDPTLSGTVNGATDVDYFHYAGTDKFGCVVDPTAYTSAPVRLCMFVTCTKGYTEFKGCSKGATAEELNAGTTGGCCVDTPETHVRVDYKCHHPLGFDDSSDVYIRVDQPNANACVNYDVRYHF